MKNDAVYLHHIRDAINRIQGYIAGVSYDQFLQDRLLQDGVVRQLEIIGEAARNVSSTFRDAHPELPWKQMTGIRDKLFTTTSKLISSSFGTQYNPIFHL